MAVNQPRSTQRYKVGARTDEQAVCRRLREIVRRRPRFGYRRLTAVLRQEGWLVNRKRIHRLCRKEGLKVRQKVRKRRAVGVSGNSCHLRRAERPNHVWTWDFAFDRTASGTTLKWLSIVDEYTRECVSLTVARSINSEAVIDTLAELFRTRAVPESIRSDNGPEFVAGAIRKWLDQLHVKTLYVAPGSPWENGYAESFHSRLRDEFLGLETFDKLSTARKLAEQWRSDYNHHRPHSSLGYQTPAGFATAAGGLAPFGLRPHSASPPAVPTLIPNPVLS